MTRARRGLCAAAAVMWCLGGAGRPALAATAREALSAASLRSGGAARRAEAARAPTRKTPPAPDAGSLPRGRAASERDAHAPRTTATTEREERRISLLRSVPADDDRRSPRDARATSVGGAAGEREPKNAGSAKDKRGKKKKVRPVRPLPPGASWAKWHAAPAHRGYVTVTGHGKKWSGYLVDAGGDVIPEARRQVSEALASWRTGHEMLMDERLLALVADVSDEFGGRSVRIVSGYREHSFAPGSKHKVGQAFDFSVPGVPNEQLRDFLRSLPDVGVGFYPNSTHVHLDVREKSCYWIDYSRPGEHPMYAWQRRVGGYTPAERVLASALDDLSAHPFRTERTERAAKVTPREEPRRASRNVGNDANTTRDARGVTSHDAPDGGAERAATNTADAGAAATDAGVPARRRAATPGNDVRARTEPVLPDLRRNRHDDVDQDDDDGDDAPGFDPG